MKRKDILKTGFAGILGVSLLMGGASYAYLQSESQAVTNNFQAYIVDVEISGDENQNFQIIPGTSQQQNRTVTVNKGLPTYVFVEVEDTTGGLVEYSIDTNIWTQLEKHKNVYYLVHNGETEGKYPVLEGDQISYSKDLTNSDMLNGETLKDNLKLTFQAHAIQRDPFKTPEQAYMAIKGVDLENAIVIENSEQLKEHLTHVNSNNVTLFLKNGTYDLANGSHINGNNLTVVGESKDGVIINVGTSEACHRGQASILVDANNAVFRNLTLTNNSASEKYIIKSFEQHDITLDTVKVINNGLKTAVNVHNGNAVIKNSYIQHTNFFNGVPAVTATQSHVIVKDSTVELKNPVVGHFGFNYAANSASYNDSTPSKLELTNVTGITPAKKCVKITSERDYVLNTKLDRVYWNGNLIEEDGDQGFTVQNNKWTKIKTYEKTL